MKIKINNNIIPWFIKWRGNARMYLVDTLDITPCNFRTIKQWLNRNKTKYVICDIRTKKFNELTTNKQLTPCLFVDFLEEYGSYTCDYAYTYRCKITPKLSLLDVEIKYIYYNKYYVIK